MGEAMTKLGEIESEIYPAEPNGMFPKRWHNERRFPGEYMAPVAQFYNRDIAYLFKAMRIWRQVAINEYQRTTREQDSAAQWVDSKFEELMKDAAR